MATSHTTLSSLWVEDGNGSPVKATLAPTKTLVNATLTADGILKYYQESGLEPIAKEAGILNSNGDLTNLRNQRIIQTKGAKIPIIAVPMQSPAKMSPYKVDGPHILPKSVNSSPVILGTPGRGGHAPTFVTASPQTPRQVINTIKVESPQQWQVAGMKKRPGDFLEADFLDSKRSKKGEKGGKGLRHFSMKVCEKVQRKGVTSYNEVADELVAEFSDPRNMSPTDQAYDQKNIRRRVYDALNVLMAMNIISKEKKEIKWIGLPTNSAQECQNLEVDKQRLLDRINYKTQQLQELILQQIAFKNLVQRNRDLQRSQGAPAANSAIHLPYIIVNTSKKTVIDCSISNDKYEYLFNFDNTFEIHDDIEVLKRMGMAYGLEKGQASMEQLKKATKLVPKALEPYVLDLGKGTSSASSVMPGPSGLRRVEAAASSARNLRLEPLALPLSLASDSTDAEVAMATQNALSRQSSIGSFSDIAPSRGATDTPSELGFSDDDESERSSPVE